MIPVLPKRQSCSKTAFGIEAGLELTDLISTHLRYDGNLSSTSQDRRTSGALSFRF